MLGFIAAIVGVLAVAYVFSKIGKLIEETEYINRINLIYVIMLKNKVSIDDWEEFDASVLHLMNSNIKRYHCIMLKVIRSRYNKIRRKQVKRLLGKTVQG